MLKYDREALKKLLVEEEHYSEYMAERKAEALENLDERLQGALDVYMKDRAVTDFSVEGVTLKFIMEKERFNFFGALTRMSVFLEEPELAKDFLTAPGFYRGKPRPKR